MVKGRLYTYGHSSLERRSAQTVIYDILYSLVRLMAPIFVFTADEIWKCMPKYKNDSDITSVHILSWPSAIGIGESNLDAVISLIPEVAKALEEKRAKGEIGSSFDAQINLLTKDEIRYNVLASLKDELPEVFKVSSVNIEKVSSLESEKGLVSKAFGDLAVIVRKADGVKCVRCWNYSLSTGESAKHPLICSKCEAAVSGEEK
jgi:isoleucyl-tRNA synthetase